MKKIRHALDAGSSFIKHLDLHERVWHIFNDVVVVQLAGRGQGVTQPLRIFPKRIGAADHDMRRGQLGRS